MHERFLSKDTSARLTRVLTSACALIVTMCCIHSPAWADPQGSDLANADFLGSGWLRPWVVALLILGPLTILAIYRWRSIVLAIRNIKRRTADRRRH